MNIYLIRAFLLVVCLIPSFVHAQSPGSYLITESVPASPLPGWVTGLAWDDDSSQIVLTQLDTSEVLATSAAGRLIRRAAPPRLTGVESDLSPSGVQAITGGYVMELNSLPQDGRFAWVDEQFNLLHWVDMMAEARNGAGRVGSFVSWAVAGDHLFSFGDVQDSRGNWSLAVSRIPLDNPQAFEVILLVPEELRLIYHLGFRSVAAQGSDAFFLLWGSQPRVFRLPTEEHEVLPELIYEFPTTYGVPSLLPSGKAGKAAMNSIFYAIEYATMPVQLVATSTDLYALTRKREGGASQDIEWALRRLSPAGGEPVSQEIPLPALQGSPHALATGGTSSLLILGRGRVKMQPNGFPTQATGAIVRVAPR